MSQDREPISHRLLRGFIDEAVRAQADPRVALYAAARIDAGAWRLHSWFSLDETGEPIPGSLMYEVQVWCWDGRWRALCTVDWRLLGLEVADVQVALEDVLRQHEQGTWPGGPNDPNG